VDRAEICGGGTGVLSFDGSAACVAGLKKPGHSADSVVMSTSEKTLGELGYLTYSSSAVQRFSQAELKKLLEISRHNNSLRGVTGMLLYREGQFLQYLEGPRETVNDTFERIKKDDRHYGSQIVAQGPLPGRIFPEWSMGYKSLAGVRSRNTPGYSECLQPTFRPSGEGDPAERLKELFYRLLCAA
jgi:hypothetical protein